jgi:N-acetylneuraminic acid mutarotase
MSMKKIITLLSILFSVALFSQTQNFWTKKNDFGGLKRERCVAVSINGKGYIGTGVDTNEVVHRDWWQYDPATDLWTQKANVPGAVRRNAVAFVANNLGYVGTGIDSADAFNGTAQRDFWRYNSQANTWTPIANFPGANNMGIYFATAFSLDNKGYVCCGKIGSDNYSKEFWEYKPFNDTWYRLADFPGTPRYQLSSFTVSGKAYIGLGADYNVYCDDMYEYNAGNGIWTPKIDFPGGVRGSACTFTLGERGFVCLGVDGGLKGDLWEYNPYLDNWTARASYGGSARKTAAAFTIGDRAFVGTGDGYSGKKASMYEYTPMLILSVEEYQNASVAIYPNPIHDYFIVNMNQSYTGTVSLFSCEGKLIQAESFRNQSQIQMNCAEQADGIYLLVIADENGNKIANEKLILRAAL